MTKAIEKRNTSSELRKWHSQTKRPYSIKRKQNQIFFLFSNIRAFYILALIRFGNGCVVAECTLSNMSIKSHLVLLTEINGIRLGASLVAVMSLSILFQLDCYNWLKIVYFDPEIRHTDRPRHEVIPAYLFFLLFFLVSMNFFIFFWFGNRTSIALLFDSIDHIDRCESSSFLSYKCLRGQTSTRISKFNIATRFKCQYDNIIGSLWDYVMEIDGFCFPNLSIWLLLLLFLTQSGDNLSMDVILLFYKEKEFLSRDKTICLFNVHFFLLYSIITTIF